MASPQVGFAASRILRDINQSERSNHRAFLKKNFEDFVNNRVGEFFLDENTHENISYICSKRNENDNSLNGNFGESKSLKDCGGKQVGDSVFSVCEKPIEAAQLVSGKASWLVQIWEERLRRSNGLNNNGPNRGHSGPSSVDNAEEPLRESFSGESDSMTEWSLRSRNSDVGENERVRVADIVKRMSNIDGENECFSLFDQVVCSPKIRGKQFFNELLMKMERDRYKELDELVDRHAVTKFKYLKRIQASLKLRILKGVEGHDGTKKSNSSEIKRISLGSNIVQLREQFSASLKQCMTFPGKEVESRRPKIYILRSSHQNKPSSLSQLNEDKHHPEFHSNVQQIMSPVQHSVSQIAESTHKETKESSDVLHATGKKSSKLDSQDSRHSSDFPQPIPKVSANFCTSSQDDISPLQHHPLSDAKEDVNEKANLNSNCPQGTKTEASNIDSQGPGENIACLPWQEQSWSFGNIHSEGTADGTMLFDNWGADDMLEEEYIDEQLMEINNDWVSDISRPRSYWEDCRQSRYQEVLNRESNNEIRQLLERGTVSSYLSSDLRDTIEGLMASRICGTHPVAVQEEDGNVDGMEQFMLSLKRDKHSLTNEAREKEEEEVGMEVDTEGSPAMQYYPVVYEAPEMANPRNWQKHEDGEESSRTSMSSHSQVTESDYLDQDQVALYYSDHSTSSSLQIPVQSQLDSWICQDPKARNIFDQATSTTSNPPLQCNIYKQEARHNNSISHSSIDVEVIDDLRWKMEQIQQEMLELRKSVKFCMDLQLKMQKLCKREVHSAIVTRGGRNSQHKRRRTHSCFICNRKQVDSLLYRCGHMCTCLECAHDLHHSCGICPICQAPIDDVVKVYNQLECR